MGNDLQLYKQLLSLPLFQGLSKGDLEEVVTHTRLGFETYNEGQYIVQENAPCHQLIFILKGDFEVETIAANHSYSITETLHAPELLQPERLWGLMQFYTKSFRCKTSCQILSMNVGSCAYIRPILSIGLYTSLLIASYALPVRKQLKLK